MLPGFDNAWTLLPGRVWLRAIAPGFLWVFVFQLSPGDGYLLQGWSSGVARGPMMDEAERCQENSGLHKTIERHRG